MSDVPSEAGGPEQVGRNDGENRTQGPAAATQSIEGTTAEQQTSLPPVSGAPVLGDGARDSSAQVAEGPTDAITPEQLAKQLGDFQIPAQQRGTATPLRSPTPRRPQQRQDSGAPEEEWILKEIHWPPLPPTPDEVERTGRAEFYVEPELKVKVICQNANGPCSLIALCNILILRNDLHIAPGRDSVTYSYLSNLLADYLLSLSGGSTPASQEAPSPHEITSVLSILPQTRYGLNLNPRFDRIEGFAGPSEAERAGDTEAVSAAPELTLFKLARVPLVHGWIADGSYGEETHAALLAAGDFDTAMEQIVEGADLAGGISALEIAATGAAGEGAAEEEAMLRMIEKRSQWTEEQERKVWRAHLLHSFLQSTSTQLTYPGLASLCQSPALLPPSGLVALFRNSHLSVLYRRPSVPPAPPSEGNLPSDSPAPRTRNRTFIPPGPELFTLVTDASLGAECEIVWESLGDVDGGGSEFFGAALRPARGRGGDWVGGGGGTGGAGEGRTVRDEGGGGARAGGVSVGAMLEGPDLALAQQLQAEEDAHYAQRTESRRDPAPSRTQLDRGTAAESTPTGGAQARAAGQPRPSNGRGTPGRGKDKKGGKEEKCLVM